MPLSYARLDVQGVFGTQVVQNTLWFHGTEWNGDVPDAASELHGYWNEFIKPTWLAMQSEFYALTKTTIQHFTSAWVPVSGAPIEFAETGPGLETGNCAGAGQTAVLRFNLVEAGALNQIVDHPQRRSYLAWGPIVEAAIGDYGNLDLLTVYGGAVADLIDALLASPTGQTQMGTCTPIRVGHDQGTGVRASKFIASAGFRTRATFRRSRNN